MIEPLHWKPFGGDRPPFEPKGRPLRVTVYCPDTSSLTEDEAFRLGVIREFARLKSLRIVDVEASAPWRLKIDLERSELGASATLIGPNDRRIEQGFHHRDWIDEAIWFLTIGARTDPQTLAVAERLPFLNFHRETHRDVFITNDPVFLRGSQRVRDANIMDLTGGLRLIGLYLRAVGDTTISTWARGSHQWGRDLFYWVLSRTRLPAMWRYFSAALRRGQAANDGTEYLANTILDRFVRVLQARDEIGFRFYRRQNNTTRDEMLYHFDYLTILLSAAFDAEARMAHRTYGITTVPVRKTSFRNRAFREALGAAGGSSLYIIVTSAQFLAFQNLLGALRNSVHSIGLRGIGIERAGASQSSLVRVFEDAKTVWESAAEMGPREDIGVTTIAGDTAIEPYTCATRLSALGFEYANQIAEATDLTRLLPAGTTTADLPSGPPNDNMFRDELRRRVDALG